MTGTGKQSSCRLTLAIIQCSDNPSLPIPHAGCMQVGLYNRSCQLGLSPNDPRLLARLKNLIPTLPLILIRLILTVDCALKAAVSVYGIVTYVNMAAWHGIQGQIEPKYVCKIQAVLTLRSTQRSARFLRGSHRGVRPAWRSFGVGHHYWDTDTFRLTLTLTLTRYYWDTDTFRRLRPEASQSSP